MGIVAALLAGCGSDDDESTTTTSSTSPPTSTTTASTATGGADRAAYVAKADAFCGRANARGQELNAKIARIDRTSSNARQALSRIADVLESEGIPEQDRLTAEFEQIEPPAADRATIERIWRLQEQRGQFLPRLLEAARRGDGDAFKTIAAQQERFSQGVRAAFQAFGFRVCGRGAAR